VLQHLPNFLSLLRLAAAPLVAGLVLIGHDTAALVLFAAAGLSDGLDGYVARHWRWTSRFGAWLDPAADKLLMLFTYVALLGVGAAPWWLVALVIARDLAIASGWLVARLVVLPIRLEPLMIGKLCTLAQLLYAGLTLLLLAVGVMAPALMAAAALGAALATIFSAAVYAMIFLRALWAGQRPA
jgi:cardiolipin synthase